MIASPRPFSAALLLFGWSLLGPGGLSPTLHAQPAAAPVIRVNAASAKPGSPLLYGIMTEEINYSYEGGLYAELIINRSFQHSAQNPDYWSLVKDAAAAGTITLDRSEHLNVALPVSLRIDNTSVLPGPVPDAGAVPAPRQRVGVANAGYWGIPIKPSTTYRASFFAKAGNGFAGSVLLSLESNDGATVFARAQVAGVSGNWNKYEAVLTTSANVQPTAGARFVLLTNSPGTLWLSQVSLFPPTWNNRPNGLRPDLMRLLADLEPKFLRFPGGNYVEGNSPETRFDFKKTVGPVHERPGHRNGAWGYFSEDGMGLLEFLTWCEDLRMEPVVAVFAGLFLNSNVIPAGPQLEPYVQDALDEIEYITGDVGTKWGAQRAKDGHPAPFKLTYVEIGNEDSLNGGTRTYDARFTQFYRAIKAKHPAIKLIATIENVTSVTPDLIDDHQYYNSGQITARQAATRYDTADRNGPRIIFGEYATRGATPPTSDLGNALGDAAFLTGLERNADHVTMSTYAPLFLNVNPGASNWPTDLIGYDALSSFGSVSYYAQKMFSTHYGDTVLATVIENTPTERLTAERGGSAQPAVVPSLFASATRDTAKGLIYLKVVNGLGTPQPGNIELAGVDIAANGEAVVLTSANLTDANSIAEPTKVVPKTEPATGLGRRFTRTFPARSVTVLILKTN